MRTLRRVIDFMEAADRRMRALMAIGAAGSAGLGAVVLRTARAAALDEMTALEGLLGAAAGLLRAGGASDAAAAASDGTRGHVVGVACVVRSRQATARLPASRTASERV